MALYHRIVNVFRSTKHSRELDEELEFHIAEKVDELIEAGMSEQEAERAAALLFGNYTSQKESVREAGIANWLDALVGDLRYGARQLRLNPGFATVAILSLALGIGANSAIFQLINALQLRSLPVKNPAELAVIERAGEDFFNVGRFRGRDETFTFRHYEQVLERQEAFSGVLAQNTARFNLSRGGEMRFAAGLYISPNYLQLLGVSPMLGGWMPADAELRDCAGVGALLGYSFWQREFGGAMDVVGKMIYLSGQTFPIVGVAPPSFRGLESVRAFEVALPLCAEVLIQAEGDSYLESETAWWLNLVGRLNPGWTLERASAHMRHLSPVIFEATQPASYRPAWLEQYVANKLRAASAEAGLSSDRTEYQNPLWILLASTGLVLLIACANLANLLLAKASARRREVALRQAIGASRARLIRQLMTESALLAAGGAALGALLAYGLSRALVVFLNDGGRQLSVSLEMDWRVFGFTAVLGLATCLLFGLAPALRSADAAPADAMRGSRGSTAGSESHSLRKGLVVAQIAFSMVLLVGALLFGQSLRNILTADAGLDTEGVLVAAVNANLAQIEDGRRLVAFQQLEERIKSLPDVVSAASVRIAPFAGSSWNENVYTNRGDEKHNVYFNGVGPGFFETMKTPLLAGRDVSWRDDGSAPSVALVNEKFVSDVLGDEDPIGKTFRFEGFGVDVDPLFEIVGVVKDARYITLREQQRRIAYVPLIQSLDSSGPVALTYVIRARGSFGGLMNGVKQAMAEVNGGLMVQFRVMELQKTQSVLRERLMAHLTGGFGVLAALLSTLGLYGVMSYMVARRRGEIGVRMALGAQRGDIRGLVFGEAGRLLLIGLVIGVTASLGLSRYAASLLVGLAPNDASTLTLGCLLLLATAFAAALIPVRRATGLDPAVVLRDE